MDSLDSLVINAKILIIDDEEANVLLLEDLLEGAGYTNVKSTSDARQALPLFLTFCPDLVLLDLHMPYISGFEVMDQITARVQGRTFLPVLVLTADALPSTRRKALEEGASDFLNKPFVIAEVLLRIRNLLQVRMLQLQVEHQNQVLEQRVRERTQELEEATVQISRLATERQEAHIEMLERLAIAAEFRDDETGEHVQRVSQNSTLLARAMKLPDEEAGLIGKAATLHDIGKIGISDLILLKPGPLTPEEFETMKAHTLIGARILSGSRSPLLQMAETIALTHHEKWDGTGYSPGLGGEAIPLASRIVAVVDVFDALTHDRPYKKAWAVSDAVAEIESQAGRHFDPAVVEAFMHLQHHKMT